MTIDGSNRLKPDIAAPGVLVLTSSPPSTYGPQSGTSFAAPHVAGVVALLWSAYPALARDIDTTRSVLETSANPAVTVPTDEMCGGISVSTIPNNSFGYGRVDALAAINAAASLPTPTATATVSGRSGDDSGCAINTRNPADGGTILLLLPGMLVLRLRRARRKTGTRIAS